MTKETSLLLPPESSVVSSSPSKGILLHTFTVFSCITVLWLVAILLIQIFLLVLSLLRVDGIDKSSFVTISYNFIVIESGVRLYMITFSVVGVLIELEITAAARSSSLCQFWEFRGFGFIFIGILHAYTYLDEELNNSTSIFLNVTSYGVIFSGVVYILLGLFNLKRIRDEKMARYIQLISFMEVSEPVLHFQYFP